jgi:DNA-binding XRE family transcriptional regulator
MKYDLLHIQGKPYVLVPLHEYRQMSAAGPGQKTRNLPDEILDKIAAGQESAIRILRRFRGLTQNELSEAAGISRPYLTEIETGKKNGSIKALRKIAKALNVQTGILAGA